MNYGLPPRVEKSLEVHARKKRV